MKKLKGIFKKIVSSSIYKSIKSNLTKKYKLKSLDKEIFLYHGSLLVKEPQFKDQRFVGLPFKYQNHNREIICDLNKSLPSTS